MLTPQQIAEMDSITGRSTPTAKTSPGISRANEIRALGSNNVSFMEKLKYILTGPKRQARVEEIVQPYKEGTQKLLPTIFQLGGEVIKGAFESASELPIVKQGLGLLGEGINEMSQDKVIKYLGEKLTPATEQVLSWYESRTPEEKRNIDAASQYLSIMPVGKATETGVSSGIKATERMVYTASDVVKATGRGTSQVFGATTGAGASSVKEAFVAASEGKPALESFTRALRGQTPASDIVKSVEDITQTVKEQRAANYTSKLKEIGEDVSQHNIAPVLSELDSQLGKFGIAKNADGTLDFSRSAIAKSREARNDIQGVYETIKDWGTKKGDRTGIGLDTLKRQLGDFYSDSSQAKAFVQGIKRKVTDILETEVKGYTEMTSEYQKASAFLDDIRSATGSGTSASPDTIFTKLTTGMKADKEFRLEIMKEMEKVDPQLMNKIAGINLSPWMPRGLVGRATDAGAALGALTGFFNPQLIPFLLATSPRVVGEFARAAGIATNKINEILNSIKILSSLKVDVKGVLESIKEIHNQEGGFIKIPSFGPEESVPKSILEKSVQKTVPSPNTNINKSKDQVTDFSMFHPEDQQFLIKFADDVANRKAVPQRNFEIAKQTWESEGFTVPKTKKELADLISQAQQSSFNVEIDKNIFK